MKLIKLLNTTWLTGLMILFFLAPLIMIRGPEGGFHNLVLKETFCQALILFVLFTVIAKKLIEKRITLTRSSLDFPFIVLPILTAISLIYSPTIYTSVQEFSKLATFILFYFLLIDQIQDRKKMELLFIPIIASAIITAFFATCQNQQVYLWGFLPRAEGRNRMMATMGHNNGVASYLMMTGFILLGLLLSAKRTRRGKTLFIVLLIWFLFVIIATLSRGVWMGTFIGLIIFSYFLIQRWGLKTVWRLYKKPIVIGTIVIVLFVILLSIKSPLNPWKVSVVNRFSETWLTWQSYVSDTRIRMWVTTWEMIRDHPFRGIGIGAFKYLVPLYQGKFFERHPDTKLEPTSALTNESHNEYLQLWAELGILGFLIGLIAIVVYLISGWRTINRMRVLEEKHPEAEVSYGTLFAGLYAGSIGIFIQSLVDFPLHIAPLALLFLFLVALVMNAKRIVAVKVIPPIHEERVPQFELRNLLFIISIIIFYIITLVPLSFILISNRCQQQCGYFLAQTDAYANEPDNPNRIQLIQKAVEAGVKSVMYQPHSGRAQYYLGLAYIQSGDLPSGISHLRLAQQDLEYRDLHYILGQAYEKLGLYPAAITEYKRAVYIYPPSTDALGQLSMLFDKTGQTAEMVNVWKKLVKYNPKFIEETVIPLGKEYRRQKKWDMAQTVYEWAVSVDSTNIAIWGGLEGVYQNTKQYTKLISVCKTMLELDPKAVQCYQKLAIAYLGLGNFAEAKRYAQKAVAVSPFYALSKRIIREADKKNAVQL